MKMIRRIFDMLVVLAVTALLGMLSYLQVGGEALPAKFIPWAELVIVVLFLFTVILNAPHYWRSARLLIFGVLPLLALIVSVVLPQYLGIEVPVVANIVFYFYLLYWHLFLATTEKHRGEAVPEKVPVQAGKPKAARKAAKPAEQKE